MEKGWQENGMLTSYYGMLAVVTLEEQIVGDVSYHHQRYGPNEASMAYNIGITLAPEYRGLGYGVEAQKLLAQYLFSAYPIVRVEASTEVRCS